MKLSIITPVYNAAPTIEKTILSVVNQPIESELQYIIVDGGSTDGTLDIINQYSDKIDIIISEKDRGAYDAMNKGIACATGDIICIINSDDWYHEGTLRIVEQFFAITPETSIIYSPIDNYYNGKYLNTFIPGSLENLVFKFTINHPSCFVKKIVYQTIGLFNLTYTVAADYDLILRAYIAGFKFHYVETPLVSYSLNGITSQPLNKFKQIQESWQVGANIASQSSETLAARRRKFYLIWLLKELALFPLKQWLNPHITRQIKQILRQKLGQLPSDKYGAW